MAVMSKAAINIRSWRIGELAKAAGVSADTLRYYERKKVLSSRRSSNGYREYPADALERVRMIRQALAIGFSLDELSTIFKVLDRGGAPCHEVRQLAANRLTEIEEHLADVTALRNELKNSLKDWDERLANTPSGKRAGLLSALGTRNLQRSATSLLLRKPKSKKKGNQNE
jgi:DNA-binding transcriptional MerR regulator